LVELAEDIAALILGDADPAVADIGGSGGKRRGGSLKGRKVAPKYRNPANKSETWAGNPEEGLSDVVLVIA
jgi:hypothetical protein